MLALSSVNVCKIALREAIGLDISPDEMRNGFHNPFGPIISSVNCNKIALREAIGPNIWPDEMRNSCHNPFGPIILSIT